jgi:hypothetical protein
MTLPTITLMSIVTTELQIMTITEIRDDDVRYQEITCNIMILLRMSLLKMTSLKMILFGITLLQNDTYKEINYLE